MGALVVALASAMPAHANTITGTFTITATGDDILKSGTILSKETGVGKSDFTEGSVSASGIPATDTLTGSFSESLSSGGQYGKVEFFDFESHAIVDFPGFLPESTLTVSFSGLSDGSAATSCSNSCSLSTTVDLDANAFDFGNDVLTVAFADGAMLTLTVEDHHDNPPPDPCANNACDIPGEITLNYQGPTQSVPEPASLALLGGGLISFYLVRRRRRIASN